MKIYTEIVFDMETGVVVEGAFFEHDGSVAQCKGAKQAPPAPPPPPNIQPRQRTAQTAQSLDLQRRRRRQRLGEQANIQTGALGLDPDEAVNIGRQLLG